MMAAGSGEPHLETTPVVFRKILVVTDYSPLAQKALAAANRLATLFSAEMTVLHSLRPMAAPYGDEAGVEMRQQIMNEALEAMELELASISVPHTGLVQEGVLTLQVEELVRERQIDLIVAGSRGAQGLDKLIFGSTAESLIRLAPCPVLIVGPKAKAVDALQSILFAADLEVESLRAAQYAAALTRTMQGRLTIDHVVNVIGPPTAEVRRSIEEQLKQLLPRDVAMDFEAKIQVDHGPAVPSLLRAAKACGAELIVTGCRHNSMVGHHTTWRTLSKLIHDADCPVLVVNGRLGEKTSP